MTGLSLAFIVAALALGVFSSLSFLWQWLVGGASRISSMLALVAAGTAAVRLYVYLRRCAPQAPARLGAGWMLLGTACGAAGYWYARLAAGAPHGGWDAWAIWNLHARFLYRGGPAWKDLFDPALGWSMNAYPLLIPGLVDGVWKILGSEAQAVPAVIAGLFAMLAIGITSSGVSAITEDRRAWLAGLVLLGTPSFLLLSSAQMADAPLSVYMLATVVLLRFAEVWPQARTPMLALAGFAAGCAAWTKMEGLVFVAVVFGGLLILAAAQGTWRDYWKDGLRIASGAAPMLILVLSFRAFLAPPGDMLLDSAAIERMTTLARYPVAASAFAKEFAGFGAALGGVHPGILASLLLLWAIGRAKGCFSALRLLVFPILMLGAYFTIYIVTPYDLAWHLEYSLDRLVLHVWPAAVFVAATVHCRRGQ